MRHASLAAALLCVGCTFDFPRELAPGELRGTVVWEQAGGASVPAAGARVRLDAGRVSATCDKDGRFVLRDVPAGIHELEIRHDGDSDGEPDAGLRVRNIALAALQDRRPDGRNLGRLVVGAFGEIKGAVVQSGSPVAQARVVASPRAQRVAAQGAFRFDRMLPGDYELAVALDETGDARAVGGIAAKVPPGGSAEVTIDLGTTAPVATGRVSGSALLAGQRSHTDVAISLASADGVTEVARTDADGAYESADVPAGVYTLVASTDGHAPATLPNVVVAGDTKLATLLLHPDAGACAPDGSGSGATDEDGDGVADAEEPAACRCDADGTVDADTDALCDNVDPDTDADGAPNDLDNCPSLANADQADADTDGTGCACDNCPKVPNPGQENTDEDPRGDACQNLVDWCGGAPAALVDGATASPDGGTSGLSELCLPGAAGNSVFFSVTVPAGRELAVLVRRKAGSNFTGAFALRVLAGCQAEACLGSSAIGGLFPFVRVSNPGPAAQWIVALSAVNPALPAGDVQVFFQIQKPIRTLATIASQPVRATADATQAFWTEVDPGSGSGRAMRAALDGTGSPTEVAASTWPAWVQRQGGYFYWLFQGSTGSATGGISRVPVAGGAVESVAAGLRSPQWGLAVSSDEAFWMENRLGQGGPSIYHVWLSDMGGAGQMVPSIPSGDYRSLCWTAADPNYLYFSNWTAGLYKAPTAGSTPTLVDPNGYRNQSEVCGGGGRIAWISDWSYVTSAALDGTGPVALSPWENGRDVTGLGCDDTHAWVLAGYGDCWNKKCFTRVLRVPLAGGPAEPVALLDTPPNRSLAVTATHLVWMDTTGNTGGHVYAAER